MLDVRSNVSDSNRGCECITCSLNGVAAAASKAPVLIKTREGEGER
jgi:hypothetical protein